jgi:hypothetical protein
MDMTLPADHPEADSAQQAEPGTVDPDFRVIKSDATTWKLEAVSSRARAFMQRNPAIGGEEAKAGMVFTDHRGVNDLILHVRTRGYTTDLVGPRGPVRV